MHGHPRSERLAVKTPDKKLMSASESLSRAPGIDVLSLNHGSYVAELGSLVASASRWMMQHQIQLKS